LTNPSETRRPRVCAVSYLNTVPLVWGMLEGPQRERFDLSFALPSECADRLAAGEADIGIVPVAALLEQKLAILRGAGIACRGPVRSILFVSRRPPGDVRTLAADAGSRSSVLLARILLAERYGAEPEVLTMPPDLNHMLQEADAALIIGDPALRLDPETLRASLHVLDLGAEWVEMTGLPMVFAVWAGPAGLATPVIESAFTGSCQYGLEHLDRIVETESLRRGFSPELVRRYLTRHIVFELGAREYQGMDLFLRRAARLDTLVNSGAAR